jgi:hypothetical protein
MTFRNRLLIACALLLFLPAAIWSVQGNPFIPEDDFDAATVYNPWEEDHSLPHGVDPVSRDALAKYFEPGDHVWNLESGDAESGRAIAHPHGKRACASGCAADQHPTPPLLKQEFNRLVGLYAQEPMSDQSEGLEYLLYYGRQSLLYLDRLGSQPLDGERARYLRKELERLHVCVELRVVDEHGVVRVWNRPARVPLDVRHGFEFETKDYQRIEESTGTVKRVGLYHLWQRI